VKKNVSEYKNTLGTVHALRKLMDLFTGGTIFNSGCLPRRESSLEEERSLTICCSCSLRIVPFNSSMWMLTRFGSGIKKKKRI
jgi:hypothetical protein